MISLKNATPEFCEEGKRWARRQPNLATAWARCRNGCWMAWWLRSYRGVSSMELISLVPDDAICKGLCYTGANWTPEERREYARILRGRFHPSGRRRAEVA